MTTPLSHEAGHGVQLTHLEIGAHTGTHLDAPRHFIAGGGLVTALDLNVLIGPARVVRYADEGPIPVAFFEGLNLPPATTRLLLRCDHNAGRLHESPDFFADYAAVTPEAAAWLVAHGVRLIGTDYLSIGPYHEGNTEVHLALLGKRDGDRRRFGPARGRTWRLYADLSADRDSRRWRALPRRAFARSRAFGSRVRSFRYASSRSCRIAVNARRHGGKSGGG